jgi:hypothetical protein
MAVRALGAHPIFDLQNLFLNGDVEGYVIQVSPEEEAGGVLCGHGGYLLLVYGFYFGNFISNFTDEGRFVSFTPMGDGCEEGGVGFDQ